MTHKRCYSAEPWAWQWKIPFKISTNKQAKRFFSTEYSWGTDRVKSKSYQKARQSTRDKVWLNLRLDFWVTTVVEYFEFFLISGVRRIKFISVAKQCGISICDWRKTNDLGCRSSLNKMVMIRMIKIIYADLFRIVVWCGRLRILVNAGDG